MLLGSDDGSRSRLFSSRWPLANAAHVAAWRTLRETPTDVVERAAKGNAIMKSVIVVCVLILAPSAIATITVPPTLSEVIAGSESIGLVEIKSAEVYEVQDSEGLISCGVIYSGRWLDSLSGDIGNLQFTSDQILEPTGRYLVYLGQSKLPRKIMSTNSWSERRRMQQLERRELCTRSNVLPGTIFESSKFIDERHVADNLKTGIWVKAPHFSKSPLEQIVIHPTSLRIGDVEMSRIELLTDHIDKPEFQVIRTAGYSLLIFKAVDWKEYCTHLLEMSSSLHEDWPIASNLGFCDRRPTDGSYLR